MKVTIIRHGKVKHSKKKNSILLKSSLGLKYVISRTAEDLFVENTKDKGLDFLLKRHDVKIITSSDAHRPEDVGYKIKELNECVKVEGTV